MIKDLLLFCSQFVLRMEYKNVFDFRDFFGVEIIHKRRILMIKRGQKYTKKGEKKSVEKKIKQSIFYLLCFIFLFVNLEL
jgi:hypothetical protein